VNPVRVERCRLTFSGVEDGGWRVEFWDTVSGSMSASALVDAWDNKLVVDLPPFDNDLALKLRRTRRLISAPRPAASTPASAPPASSESAPQENPDEATTSAPPAERMIPGVRSRLLPPREDAFGLRSKDFILDWAVLGPFSFAPAKFEPPDYSGAAHVAYVPDEAGLRPVDGAIVGGRRWRKYVHARESTIPRQQIDLKAFMGNGFCAAYMAAEIWCDRPMDKVSLLVGCDDYMQVWLNGRLVHTYDTECRSVYIDNDQIDNLSLGKGSNWLVMKIVDVTGGWQAVARFADAHGRPLPVEPMGD